MLLDDNQPRWKTCTPAGSWVLSLGGLEECMVGFGFLYLPVGVYAE
jgi:hypothetical protein